jgi:ribosomal protein L7Ae-like RNA K-turn-binding protein
MNTLPLLIIGFIRVEGIKKLLKSIQSHQVSKIYLAVDGPRSVVDLDSQVDIIRLVTEFAEYHGLPVSIWHRKSNLGIAVSIITALDWFFESESFGVILEDDLLLGEDLIPFVLKSRVLIDTNPQVMMVSGNQFFPDSSSTEIMATHYPQIWGWATTSEKWQILRCGLLTQNRINLSDFLTPRRSFWAIGARRALAGQIDTWDIPIARFMISTSKICLIPPCNLVSNIGFDEHASHTISNAFPLGVPTAKINSEKLKFVIPTYSEIRKYDLNLEKNVFFISPKRILSLPWGLLRSLKAKGLNNLQHRLANFESSSLKH